MSIKGKRERLIADRVFIRMQGLPMDAIGICSMKKKRVPYFYAAAFMARIRKDGHIVWKRTGPMLSTPRRLYEITRQESIAEAVRRGYRWSCFDLSGMLVCDTLLAQPSDSK